MPATPVNTLLQSGACFSCVGMSLAQLLTLVELDAISQNIGQGGCVTPDAPVAEAASDIGNDSFTANWSDSTLATSYEFDVSESPTFAGFIVSLNVGDVNSYEVTGLDPTTTYYYRVRAVNSCGTSENSNVIEVETI